MTPLTDEDLKLLSSALDDFLEGSTGKFVVFDLETNGLMGSEVLSISAQKCQMMRGKKVVTLDHYDRYYYPEGQYNWAAIKVNGLNRKTVDAKRNGAPYPLHFSEDVHTFKNWCEGIEHFVGHNVIKFDCSFFPKDFEFKRVFDTMVVNQGIIKMPAANSYYGKFKMPKLVEAAQFYDVNTEEGTLHTSSFDVEVTTQLFAAMYRLRD